MADLTTTAYVKTVLQISGTSEDDRLAALVTAASAAVERYCQRVFTADTYTEYYSGNNTPRLALRHRPVTAVASVKVDSQGQFGLRDGSFGSSTLLTAGTDYTLDLSEDEWGSKSGLLYRIGTVWPMVARSALPSRINTEVAPAFGNVLVVYTAGFASEPADMPADVQYAVAMIVQQMRISLRHGGMLHSERIGDYAYTLADGLVMGRGREMADVLHTLAPYREIGW